MSLRDEGPHWCRRHVEGGAQRVGAAANVADVPQVDQLLHGAETYVSGDAGYTGAAKRPEYAEQDFIWSIASWPSSYK